MLHVLPIKLSLVLFFTLLFNVQFLVSQDLIHYWNFNNVTTIENHLTPNPSLVSGAGIAHVAGGISAIDLGGGTGQNFNVANVNARNGDVSGNHLRFNDPIGGALIFSLPTTGYRDLVVKYATRRSGSGAGTQVIEYTTDGSNYVPFTTKTILDANPILETLDFSSIATTDNNANFKIKITFEQGAGGLVGNNRFDNFTAEASVLSTLIHYWNFNNVSSIENHLTPNTSLVSGASIAHVAGGISAIDLTGGTGQNFNVDNINARNGDVSGNHLRFNDPIGGALIFSIPTTGYQDVVLKYATRRSGSGAGTQVIEYTIDGSNYIAFTTKTILDANPVLETLDFSSIATTDNNANFKIRITFEQGAGGLVGNNRFDNVTAEGTTFGAPDTDAPVVTFTPSNHATGVSTLVLPKLNFNEDIRLINDDPIDNTNVDNLIELKLDNASGVDVAFDAVINNHNEIVITPNAPLLTNQMYYVALKANVVEDLSNNAIASITSAVFTTAATSIGFTTKFSSVTESVGEVSVAMTLTNPSNCTVDLRIKGTPFSTASLADVDLVDQGFVYTSASATSQAITFDIINDVLSEEDEYLVLELTNPVGCTISGSPYYTLYIKDNDRLAPVGTKAIELDYITSYQTQNLVGSEGFSEIVAYDPTSRRLFTMSTALNRMDIIDFSTPSAPVEISQISLSAYGSGVNSIAVNNGIVVVCVDGLPTPQDNGKVVFFNTNGVFISQVTVGAMPDMVTFTPDGNYVMTANEGEPNQAYTVNPVGSVSFVDISGGAANVTQSNATTLTFDAYITAEGEANLINDGIRKMYSLSTLSEELEPEYITISPNSQTAWVSLQENNAIAEINIATKTVTKLWSLGLKDYSLVGNGADICDQGTDIHISNWPMKGFYMPDAIANYTVGGTTYIIGANEGDEREYIPLNERETVGAVTLDPTAFPHGSVLKENHNMGRFRISNIQGDTDNDGDYDELYCVGARSFGIWNATTGDLVFESGNNFEVITSQDPGVSPIFNADHGSNALKNRSRAKGPEPEGLTIQRINDKDYAFIGLERVGGVMVYDITDPAHPIFVDYKNSRSILEHAGDHGPEGIIFIPSTQSSDEKAYLIVSNEVSGTLTVFQVINGEEEVTSVDESMKTENTFYIFPNPAKDILKLNATASFDIMNMNGQVLKSATNQTSIFIGDLLKGMYLLRTQEGVTRKFIVE